MRQKTQQRLPEHDDLSTESLNATASASCEEGDMLYATESSFSRILTDEKVRAIQQRQMQLLATLSSLPVDVLYDRATDSSADDFYAVADVLLTHHEQLLMPMCPNDRADLLLLYASTSVEMTCRIFQTINIDDYFEVSAQTELPADDDGDFRRNTITDIVDHHGVLSAVPMWALYASYFAYDIDQFENIFEYIFYRMNSSGVDFVQCLEVFLYNEVGLTIVDRQSLLRGSIDVLKKFHRTERDRVLRAKIAVQLNKLHDLIDNLALYNQRSFSHAMKFPVGLLLHIDSHMELLAQSEAEQGKPVVIQKPVAKNGRKKTRKNKKGGQKHRQGATRPLRPTVSVFAQSAASNSWLPCVLESEGVLRECVYKLYRVSQLKTLTLRQYYQKRLLVDQQIRQLHQHIADDDVAFDRAALARRVTDALLTLYQEGDVEAGLLYAKFAVSYMVKTDANVLPVHSRYDRALRVITEITGKTSERKSSNIDAKLVARIMAKLTFLQKQRNVFGETNRYRNVLIDMFYVEPPAEPSEETVPDFDAPLPPVRPPGLCDDLSPALFRKPKPVKHLTDADLASSEEGDPVSTTEPLSSHDDSAAAEARSGPPDLWLLIEDDDAEEENGRAALAGLGPKADNNGTNGVNGSQLLLPQCGDAENRSEYLLKFLSELVADEQSVNGGTDHLQREKESKFTV